MSLSWAPAETSGLLESRAGLLSLHPQFLAHGSLSVDGG